MAPDGCFAQGREPTRRSAVEEVAKFDRCASGIAPEEIGLTLQEGKDVLKQVQRNIVQTQIQVQGVACSCCMHCSGTQLVKDIRTRRIRTVVHRDLEGVTSAKQ